MESAMDKRYSSVITLTVDGIWGAYNDKHSHHVATSLELQWLDEVLNVVYYWFRDGGTNVVILIAFVFRLAL